MATHKQYLKKGTRVFRCVLKDYQVAFLKGQAKDKGMSVSAYMQDTLDKRIGVPAANGKKTNGRQEAYYAPIVTA